MKIARYLGYRLLSGIKNNFILKFSYHSRKIPKGELKNKKDNIKCYLMFYVSSGISSVFVV